MQVLHRMHQGKCPIDQRCVVASQVLCYHQRHASTCARQLRRTDRTVAMPADYCQSTGQRSTSLQWAADLHTCLLMGEWLALVVCHGLHIRLSWDVCMETQAVVLLQDAQGEVLEQCALIGYDAPEAAHLQPCMYIGQCIVVEFFQILFQPRYAGVPLKLAGVW